MEVTLLRLVPQLDEEEKLQWEKQLQEERIHVGVDGHVAMLMEDNPKHDKYC